MKKRISALLLSVVLCLAMVGTAFAAGTSDGASALRVDITAQAGDSSLTLDFTGVARHYSSCRVRITPADKTEASLLFGFNLDPDGQTEITRDVTPLVAGDKLEVYVYNDSRELVPVVGKDGNTDFGKEGTAQSVYTVPEKKHVHTPAEAEWKTDPTQHWHECTDPDCPDGGKYDIAAHTYGDWIVDKAATATTDGSRHRVCSVCQYEQAEKIPATGGNGGNTGVSGGGSSSTTQRISVKKTTGGTVTCRPGSPSKGTTVTVTVHPNAGYVLDELRVYDRNGKLIDVTKVSDTEYTFVMPEGAVTVEPIFKSINAHATGTFSDVPSSHTFYSDISWVASKGYMGGYGDGTFRPSANTTRQALWMVLARIDGANPADMTAARSWATRNNISDGTNPGGAMSRQQMVTMLYRYAQMKGYATTGGTSLDGFKDAAAVADYAKDAMSWAVGNGIVQGNNNSLLPTGTATRAHFAAFLHRFCTTVGIA